MGKPADMQVTKLERLEVAAAAPDLAAATYQRNFGFRVRNAGPGEAIVEVGDAEIRLRVAGAGREGLTALRLVTDDLDRLADTLRRAGIAPEAAAEEEGVRAISIPARFTGNVPLIVIERKSLIERKS
jgi:hypothetical protein